jgi:hypothetical protein
MAVRGEKLGGDPQISQPMGWGLYQGPFFSEQWDLSNSVGLAWKVVVYGLSWALRVVRIRFFLQDVHRFESLRLSDMSNWLSYGCQYVDNLMNWWMKDLCWFCYNYLFVANDWFAANLGSDSNHAVLISLDLQIGAHISIKKRMPV